jgi:hypothetical protein
MALSKKMVQKLIDLADSGMSYAEIEKVTNVKHTTASYHLYYHGYRVDGDTGKLFKTNPAIAQKRYRPKLDTEIDIRAMKLLYINGYKIKDIAELCDTYADRVRFHLRKEEFYKKDSQRTYLLSDNDMLKMRNTGSKRPSNIVVTPEIKPEFPTESIKYADILFDNKKKHKNYKTIRAEAEEKRKDARAILMARLRSEKAERDLKRGCPLMKSKDYCDVTFGTNIKKTIYDKNDKKVVKNKNKSKKLLTLKQVEQIREKFASGMTQVAIGKMYKMTSSNISKIVRHIIYT